MIEPATIKKNMKQLWQSCNIVHRYKIYENNRNKKNCKRFKKNMYQKSKDTLWNEIHVVL